MDISSSVGMDAVTTEERARYVAELLQVLMEINELNGGNVNNAEKMKIHVKNFESALFAKCSTKKEYISSMKEKITAMCNTRDSRKKATMAAAAARQKQQQQQQQILSSTNNNGNPAPNSSNVNPRTFLNQQAQVRQQVAQQLKQQQQLNANINSNQQGLHQKPRPQLTAQQQFLINQMKVAPIPRELLQKIPNIPPGVNTWQQITELAQQKRFTQQEMLIAKEVYKIHQQLLYKSKMQQQQALQAQQLKQQSIQSHIQNQNQNQQQQQQQQINNMNQPMQRNIPPQHQPQQQQQQRNINRQGDIPNVLGQIHQIFTQEEQKSVLAEAIEACKHFQKTQYGGNMTDAAKHNFIKKYINQKALKKIQAIKMSQTAAAAAARNGSGNGIGAEVGTNTITSNASNINNPNSNHNGNNNSNNFSNQRLQGNNNIQNAMSNSNGGNYSNAQTSQNVSISQMNNNSNSDNNNRNLRQAQNNQMVNQQSGNTQMGQLPIRNHANNNQMQNTQKLPVNNGQQSNSGLQMFQPTQHDLEMVRKISAAAARIPLRLTDLTNMISPQEREEIKRKLQANQQLFAQVSNYAPQVYVFTKSEPFLKEVLQLRIFVKEILEKCSRGIYVVKLDTVDKLVMKYQKYWESMKLQILRRQQLIEQQKRLQQQQQQVERSMVNQQQGNIPNNNKNNNNNNNNGTMTRMGSQGQTPSMSQQQLNQQQQQQWKANQQTVVPPGVNNTNMFPPQNFNNLSKNGSISNTPQLPQANMNDLNKNKPSLNNNNNNNILVGVPDMSKIPTTLQGVSPKKEGSTPHSRNKSTSKKSSPTMTNGFSSTNMSTLPSKSGTPRNAGVLPNSNNGTVSSSVQLSASSSSPAAAAADQNIIQHNGTPLQMAFKKEAETLETLNIKKSEIVSRFKHRQDLFRSSPIDIFLGTLADTLGIKDEDIDPPVMKISKHTIDTINGTGKRKLTKVQQRVRDRDSVDVHINDEHRLIMKSKAVKEGRLYDIKLKAIAEVFKSVTTDGENSIVQYMVNENTLETPSITNFESGKKRKIGDSDLDTASNSDLISPTTGSLMGESKRIKLDSPEDMFSEGSNEINNKGDSIEYEKKLEMSKKDKINNFWNWDFWSELHGVK